MSNIIWKVKSFDELTVPELYAIIKARVDVFVVEQDCPYPDLDDYDQKAIHLWAEENGVVLANCRIFDKGIKYPETSIGRVLTTEQVLKMSKLAPEELGLEQVGENTWKLGSKFENLYTESKEENKH